MNSDTSDWPKLDESYTDEFGPIEKPVYDAAGALWPRAQRFAHDKIGDKATGQQLLLKAAASVSQKQAGIESLEAYLWKSYKWLVLEELEKRSREDRLDEVIGPRQSVPDQSLDDAILLQQVLQAMEPETRRVFELRALGHTFEEIASQRGTRANHLRSQFAKQIRKLRQHFG